MSQGLATPPQEQGRALPAKPGMLHPRLAAAAAGAGAVSHAFMLSTHTTPVAVALAVVMTAACVPCAVSLWRRGDPRSARMLMAMSLAMVTIHGFMLTGSLTSAAPHAGHTARAGHVAGGGEASRAVSMIAVMGCDYIAAALAALWLSRLRSARRRDGVSDGQQDSLTTAS